jgi:hypothetical protein
LELRANWLRRRTILSSETEDNRSDEEDEVDVVGDAAAAAPLLLSDSNEKANAGALPLAGLLGEKALPLLLGVGDKAGRLEKSILDEREEKGEENESEIEKRDGEDRLGASLKRVRGRFFAFLVQAAFGLRPNRVGIGFGGNVAHLVVAHLLRGWHHGPHLGTGC